METRAINEGHDFRYFISPNASVYGAWSHGSFMELAKTVEVVKFQSRLSFADLKDEHMS